MAERFIKFVPSPNSDFLRAKHPIAFILLSLIAERARRVPGHADGLQVGDAWVGDYKTIGITRKQYRTALQILEELKLIEIVLTSKSAKKGPSIVKKRAINGAIVGTLVNLSGSTIWDINIIEEGHSQGHEVEILGPLKGHKQERKRMKEKEERKKIKKEMGNIFPISSFPDQIIEMPKKSRKSKKAATPEIEKDLYKEFIYLSKEEYAELLALHGEQDLLWLIQRLNDGIGAKNYTYKSHAYMLRKTQWVYAELEKHKAKNPTFPQQQKDTEPKFKASKVISSAGRD